MEDIFEIEGRTVGWQQPAFITAEIGLNHGGDPEMARQLIEAAADAGVDAVKFQVFRASSFISGELAKAKHQKVSLESSESVFEMWQRLELSSEELRGLCEQARKLGLVFHASAFDRESVEFLSELGVGVFKIASGEVTNLPLIRATAAAGKPIIMSIGMASLGEIEAALEAIGQAGNSRAVLMHCVANYPAKPQDVHLRRIEKLREVFGLPVGYSDHTTAPWACVASIAFGASFIEKHFTLNKDQPGTDHALSADPAEMKAIVEGIREVEAALGSNALKPLETEKEGRTLFRRGLVATKAIAEGETITAEMIAAKRPATGIEPQHFDLVIGRQARRAIASGAPLTWDSI
ncbi:MAG: N-acetylneuraminate synthase family protein [Verrucomicrobiota bacterium]|nr:N-acetylneuraminate synthase family protein [Verrucomicrobiota bacterium]